MHKMFFLLFVLPTHAFVESAYAESDAVIACKQLVTDYAFYRDRPDADGVANLFTEEATFTLMGTSFEGREAIRERVAGGIGGPVFRHMMSTINIEVDPSGNSATGISYVTVYQGSAEPTPQPMLAPMAIGEYHDKFVKGDSGWQIAERRFVPVFLNPPAS